MAAKSDILYNNTWNYVSSVGNGRDVDGRAAIWEKMTVIDDLSVA